jgi:hypothetical protein
MCLPHRLTYRKRGASTAGNPLQKLNPKRKTMNPDQLINSIRQSVEANYRENEVGKQLAHIQMLEDKIRELMHLVNETKAIINQIREELK